MEKYLYLSLIPEALIASMLPPNEFGTYYAVGTTKKNRGQALFIELDTSFRDPHFKIDEGFDLCVPHEDGSPKKSLYISAYRVLEHVPLSMMKKAHIVTQYGETLSLESSRTIPKNEAGLYLYQEIAPLSSLVVSTMSPLNFYETITKKPISLINVPAIAFVELRLGELALDPEFGAPQDLPYPYIPQLREALLELKTKRIQHKIVNRSDSIQFPYRMIQSGIYIGNTDDLLYFPIPPRDELRSKYYRWWRSATF